MQEPVELPDTILSDTEVREVLKRAASLDAQSGSVSARELLRASEEAGFSTEVVAAAIREVLEGRISSYVAGQTPTPGDSAAAEVRKDDASGGAHAWRHLSGAVAAGGAAGLLSQLAGGSPFDGSGADLLAIIVLAAVTVFRAAHHREERASEKFQLENAGLWGGYSVAWSLLRGSVSVEFVVVAAVLWIVTATIGALVTAVGSSDKGVSAESSPRSTIREMNPILHGPPLGKGEPTDGPHV